jgi:hypothetical protein
MLLFYCITITNSEKHKSMNTFLKIGTFAMLAFTLNACDWFEDKATKDISFNSDLSVDLYAEQNDSALMTEEFLLDPLSDEEILEYKDDIKDIEVTSLGFIVSDVDLSGSNLLFSGQLEYSEGVGDKKLLAAFSDLDLSALAESGVEHAVAIPDSEVENIVRIFKDNNAVTLYLSGELNNIPASFQLEVIAHLKVTAEIGI